MKYSKAFTLVEMIISLGIFAIVAVIALGALVRIITANQKAQTLSAAMTNLNFALESMSREIRVGTQYYCDTDPASSINVPIDGTNGGIASIRGCTISDTNNIRATTNWSDASVIAFDSSQRNRSNTCNLAYAYAFVNVSSDTQNPDIRLRKYEQPRTRICLDAIPQPVANGGSDSNYIDLLSENSNVKVVDYRLGVDTTSAYPVVYIRLTGYAGTSEKEKTYFDVETTISSRVPQS